MERKEWSLILEFFWERIRIPCRSVAYILYFVIIVIIVGILGSLISSFSNFNFLNISLSLIGYSVVLSCSSSIDLIFMASNSDESERFNFPAIRNAISMIGIALIILSLIGAIFVLWVPSDIIKFSVSLIFCFLAMLFWWISNARTLSVLNVSILPSNESTTGGDPNATLAGNIPEGYKE